MAWSCSPLLRDKLEGRMLGKRTRGRKRLQLVSNICYEGTSYKSVKKRAEDRCLWRVFEMELGSQWFAILAVATSEEEEEKEEDVVSQPFLYYLLMQDTVLPTNPSLFSMANTHCFTCQPLPIVHINKPCIKCILMLNFAYNLSEHITLFHMLSMWNSVMRFLLRKRPSSSGGLVFAFGPHWGLLSPRPIVCGVEKNP